MSEERTYRYDQQTFFITRSNVETQYARRTPDGGIEVNTEHEAIIEDDDCLAMLLTTEEAAAFGRWITEWSTTLN